MIRLYLGEECARTRGAGAKAARGTGRVAEMPPVMRGPRPFLSCRARAGGSVRGTETLMELGRLGFEAHAQRSRERAAGAVTSPVAELPPPPPPVRECLATVSPHCS